MVSEYIGFVSWIEEPAEIKNLNLEDAVMYSSSTWPGQGLFVGTMSGGSVINCTTDAACSIKSAEDIGGIVGYNDGGIVSDCTNYADVIGDIAGGVVGFNVGTVSNCKNYGNVTGRQIGGVVGNDEFGEILNCTNYGKVIYEAYGAIVHQDCAGGVIGYCHGTENYSGIENKGEVTSNGNCEYIGNLIGYIATTESPLN